MSSLFVVGYYSQCSFFENVRVSLALEKAPGYGVKLTHGLREGTGAGYLSVVLKFLGFSHCQRLRRPGIIKQRAQHILMKLINCATFKNISMFVLCRVINQIVYLGLKENIKVRKTGYAIRRDFDCIVKR